MERIKLSIENTVTIGENVNDKTISYFEVFFDTTDQNIRVKNSNMVLKLIIKGEYSQEDGSGALKGLNSIFQWAKEKTSSANYRLVSVDIFDQDAETPNRSYKFPDMFVVDYHENYIVGNDSKISFELILNQKNGAGFDNMESILKKV